ncbi:MAG: aminoacetone oxidase family FAD-binding enzyme [Clostridiaceae bacterium]|jgi:predicted Rossmann fold flavoprotein|nr:aminoacetone oxidase family FAD-binding enzyme [Clostridiaceae bacterium]
MSQTAEQVPTCAVAIVGGGAAGLACAIAAGRIWAEQQALAPALLGKPAEERPAGQLPVVLLEKQDRLGRKLLATGNGRCNLSHQPLDRAAYHGTDPAFADAALNRFGANETLDWFRQLGLLCRTDPDGRVFPYSYQASAVLDLLRLELDRLPVAVLTRWRAAAIQPDGKSGLTVISEADDRLSAGQVVLATGGLAAPAFGCQGDGYTLLGALGHRLIEPKPAIVQLTTPREAVRAWTGIKVEGRATLRRGSAILRQEDGEILFTEYGVSGPPILQLAGLVNQHSARSGRPLQLEIDFLPLLAEAAVTGFLAARLARNGQLPLKSLLTGLVHKRIGQSLARQVSGLSLDAPCASLDMLQLQQLAWQLKRWPVPVTGTRDWTQAQVTAGGLQTADFDPDTLASRRVPGLYAAGEVLDIDGDCGGYNLQWAWSSGRQAGEAAARASLGQWPT